jgi:ATP-dependent DNA helicase RecG
VGRGQYADSAVCILLSDKEDVERLQIVARETSGLALAEQDLRLRGPGDYFGVRQSGFPELKVARLDDAPLVESARATAEALLRADPDLSSSANAPLRAHLDAFLARGGGDPS